MLADRPVVVITGGTRGIGLATAELFAREGYRVAVTYVRHRKVAEKAQALLQSITEAMVFKVDVRDGPAMAQMAETVHARWGRLDVAVHNAASGVAKPLSAVTYHHFEFTMATNAWGLIALAQATGPWMKEGGSLIGVSSLGSARAYENYGLVGSSKAALESVARHLARDFGDRGVRVNVVSAGPIDTDALRAFANREEMLREFIERSPLHQPLAVEDVAEAVWFLARQRMVNAHVLVVDGGYLAMP
ncbi:MAG: SDR family oxidoreductase [Thermaerobacter sp.]|nr:SDR family oxidoreductase [Thermaerobacter sp.]